MKPFRPSFTTILFLVAAVFGILTLLIVLIDRRSTTAQNPRINMPSGLAQVPTTWATPAPVAGQVPAGTAMPMVQEAGPVTTMGGFEATPAPVAAPPTDMLEAATQTMQGSVGRSEMELPITQPESGNFAPWPDQEAPRIQPEIPHFNPGRISPQDLAQRMGGRSSLYSQTPAPNVPPGWGQTEPDSPSGIAPIATPAEFGTRNERNPRPRATPARSAPTPRLPVITNSSTDPRMTVPDPAEIRPTSTPRPVATRLPFQSNLPVDPSLANPSAPPGGRLPTRSNMDFGSGSTGSSQPGGTTIRDGVRTTDEPPVPQFTPPSIRPRSEGPAEATSPDHPELLAQATPTPRPTPLSNMDTGSRAPILPGVEEEEEPRSTPAASLASLPRNQPPSGFGESMSSLSGQARDAPTTTAAKNQPAADSARENQILARVGKRNLNRSEGLRRVQGVMGGELGDVSEIQQQELLRKVAEAWVTQVSMADEARARKLSAQDQDTSEAMTRLSETWGENPEERMRTAGFSEADVRREVQEAALAERLVRTIYSTRFQGAGLRELYDKSPGKFPIQPSLRVREILIPAGTSAESEERARQQATEVTQAARQPGSEFTALAARHSKAPTARNGGDLGWFDHSNPAPADLLSAVAGMSPGDVTDPVRSAEGWRIYQLVDSKPVEPSFDQVKDQVTVAARQIARDAAREASLSRHRGEVLLTNPMAEPSPGSQAMAVGSTVADTPTPAPTVAAEREVAASAKPTQRRSPAPARSAAASPQTTHSPVPDVTPQSSLSHVLSRVGGQDRPGSQPVATPQTHVAKTGDVQIRSQVSIRPPGSGPRPSGEAVAALPGAMRAAGNQLLERAGLQPRTIPGEPPAESMAFINLGGAGSQAGGGTVSDSSSNRNLPDLSPTELRQAIEPSAAGAGRLPWSRPPSEPSSSARSEVASPAQAPRPSNSQDPGKQIPEGFGKPAERSVVGAAANTVKKPVTAVKGAVGGALGLFRRDRDKDK